MKTIIKTETKVGLFVIMGITILIVGTSLVGKFRLGKPSGYTVTAVFGSISGLEEKSPVRIAGVRVGQIEEIYLKDGLAYVRMRLRDDAVIREDSEVGIESLGLLGEKYIEISSGTLGKPRVEAGETVHGKDVVSMDRLISEFTDIATDIKAVTAALRSFMGPEQDKSPLSGLISNFDSMVRNIDELVGENKQGVRQAITSLGNFASRADATIADNRDDIRTIIKNFKELSESLREQAAGLTEKLDKVTDNINATIDGARTDLSEGMDEVKRLASRIDETFVSLQELVEKTRDGEGTIGKLITDDSAYNKLDKTLTSLSNISGKIERGEGTLGKLVTDDEAYGSLNETLEDVRNFIKRGEQVKLYVGFRSEYLTEHRDTKSYFSLRVNPREDKFYLFEAVDDPRGKRSFMETDTTSTLEDGTTSTIIEREDKLEDKLKFSLQFGRRFRDLVLRGGLVESTGGVGADYWFNGDKGRVSFEAFDFNRESANPHLKMTAAYTIYKDLFINVGVDDFIEEDSLSFFIGAGLTFSDDDLKYILSLTNLRP